MIVMVTGMVGTIDWFVVYGNTSAEIVSKK